jgi:hypothetical protein
MYIELPDWLKNRQKLSTFKIKMVISSLSASIDISIEILRRDMIIEIFQWI